jgi:hypothetical protein
VADGSVGATLPFVIEDVVVGSGGGVGTGSGWAVALGGTVRTTVCRWGRRTVVTQWFVIGLFELKFDCLNMNSII